MTDYVYAPSHTPSRVYRRRPFRLIFLLIPALLLGVVGVKAVRLTLYLQDAYRSGTQFGQLIRGDLNPERYTVAQSLLKESATALSNADQEMAFFQPLAKTLSFLPLFGPSVAALPTLLTAGSELTQLAVGTYPLLQPLLLAPAGTSPLTQLPAVLATAQPQLTAISAQLAQVEQVLRPINADELVLGLQKPVMALQAAVALAGPGLRLSEHLPELLGTDQPRTYLVLAENNHELRATGGFITAVGRVTVAEGKIIGIDFVDSYDPLISQIDGSLPTAPPPVQQYMGIEILLLRDANWSPDFPTTAQIVRTIYAQQTGRNVDGVITIDLHAVQLLVGAVEPLTLPGVDQVLTSATVLERIKEFWAAPLESDASLASGDTAWWKQRKDFIPLLAKSALSRLQQGSFDKLRMISALEEALNTRAVQLWFADAAVAQGVAQLGWDGALKPPATGDFLAVVDTNFGYNKVDAVLERSVQYQVEWPQGATQPGVATVAITYRHPYERPNYVCDQTPHYEDSYEEMMVRCYYDYVRVFVPAGSELLASGGLLKGTASSQRGENGAQLFSGYFILAPGAQNTVVFQYRLPATITPANYALTVRRQAGSGPLPLIATVNNQSIQTTIKAGLFTWP